MVTYHSANQLKTPANVSWAFKMVSVWVTRLHNHGEDCWSDSCPEDIIDTLHKEGKPQTFNAKEAGCSQSAVSKHVNRELSGRKTCGRKKCITNRENRSLMRIVKQNRFKNLGELHKEWTEAVVKAWRATTHRHVKEFGYSCRQRRLTWAKEKKNWTVAQRSKVLFQMRASFVFHLETKVLESGGRVEKLIAQVAWSPVLSFHSMWCLGCNVICWCWSIVLFENQRQCTRLPRNFGALHASFCWPFFKDANFIFQQNMAPAHTAKSSKKSCLNDHDVGVLDWPANSPDLNPIENLWGIVKRKIRNKSPKNADELKATDKETWASIPPQQCHKLITSMPRRIEAVIKAKGAPTKYWVHIQ